MRRHLLWATAFFCGGIIIGRYAPLGTMGWLVLSGVALFSNAVLFYAWRRVPLAALLLCAVMAGAFWYVLGRYPEGLYRDLAGETVHGEGFILTYPRESEQYLTFTVNVQKLSLQSRVLPGVGKLLLRVKPETCRSYYPGSRISFEGELSFPRGARNPGEFDYSEYLANRQVFHQVRCAQGGCTVLPGGKGLQSLAAQGREKVVRFLERLLPVEEKGLLLGLLFGDVSAISDDDWESYQRAGIVHLFAVSGIHVAFVLGLAWLVLSLLERRRGRDSNSSGQARCGGWGRLVVGILVLAGYYLLVGWTASLVRASLMAFLGMLALVAGRKQDIYTSLALAALVILLINPGEFFQAGFQLSFAAAAGLIHLTPQLERWGCGKFLAPALAAQLATLPLVAYYFNLVSPLAPFLNVLAVVLGGIVTVLALAGCIMTWTISLLAGPFFLAAGFLVSILSGFVLWWGEKDWAAMIVSAPSPFVLFTYYLVIAVLPALPRLVPFFRRLPLRLKASAGMCLLMAVLVFCWPHPPVLEVIFLDVGQGDSIFIETPGGRTVLIDGGGTPYSTYPVGRKIIKPFLRRRGLGKLDMMFMSHNDLDHSEGLLEVIPSLQVGIFLMPPAEEGNEMEKEILRKCREQKIPVLELTAGQRINLDDQAYIEVLHPAAGDVARGNNHSLVLRLVYKEAEWLFTGDVENPALEELLARKYNLRADVLKAPHHGSISSYHEGFYREVNPKAVIVSAGSNLFNHPHPDVVGYFRDRGIPCYVTKERGAVITESDGRIIRIRTMLPH